MEIANRVKPNTTLEEVYQQLALLADIEKSDKDINENDCIDSYVYPTKNTNTDTTINQSQNLKKVEYLVDSSNYKKFNFGIYLFFFKFNFFYW